MRNPSSLEKNDFYYEKHEKKRMSILPKLQKTSL